MLEWRKNVHDHHHHQQDHHQHHDHHYFHVYYVTTISYRQTRKYTMSINVVYLLLNEHCLRVNKSRSYIFKLVSICTNNNKNWNWMKKRMLILNEWTNTREKVAQNLILNITKGLWTRKISKENVCHIPLL